MDYRVRAQSVAVCIVGDVAPEADPEALAAFALRVGADGIDLRTGLGLPQALVPGNVSRWRRILQTTGLTAPILASQFELTEAAPDPKAVEALVGLADGVGITAVRLIPLTRDTAALAVHVRHLRERFPHVGWMIETTGAWAGETGGLEGAWPSGASEWLWDMAHTLAAGETAVETLDRLGLPRHVHVGHFDAAPLGRRMLPPEMVQEAVQELLRRGYDGAFSGEWLGWPESRRETEVGRSIAALRAFVGS